MSDSPIYDAMYEDTEGTLRLLLVQLWLRNAILSSTKLRGVLGL